MRPVHLAAFAMLAASAAVTMLAASAAVTMLAASAARADAVTLHLRTEGALHAEVTVTHLVDGAHFCSAAADPWTDRAAPDPRAAPYPFYRLVFGQPASGADLARPGPSIGLVLSNYFAAAHVHADLVNDSLELVIDGRHFVGHAELRDPGYRFVTTYRDDRQGGGFVAHALHEDGAGGATLDVAGDWQCPPVAADAPEQNIAAHVLFPGAEPVRAAPAALRLSRSDIPCLDRDCADWRVTDETTGAEYLARVDFRRLRLAGRLRQAARAGIIDLLVGAEVRRGDPPLVVPIDLAGVAPTVPPAPEALAGKAPEPALR